MTSGNIAVFDHDARRIADLVVEFNRLFGIDDEQIAARSKTQVNQALAAQGAGRARQRRRADDQGADPLERGQGRRDRGRLPRRASALPRPAVLPHRHDRQEPDRRRRRADHSRAARARAAARRSTSPATCPTRTARTASVPRRSFARSSRSKPRRAAGPRCCSIAAPGRNGSRTRSRSRCRSARAIWSGRRRPSSATNRRRTRPCSPAPTTARVLAAGRRPQPQHGRRLQPARPARVSSPWKASCAGTAKPI